MQKVYSKKRMCEKCDIKIGCKIISSTKLDAKKY